MLYYNFIDYQDFQEKFGIVHHGNGAKNRKNKILLAYIKKQRTPASGQNYKRLLTAAYFKHE